MKNSVPIRNTADYSPFGVQLDGRTIQGDFYRYAYQGSEKDDEAKGGGNSYTTFFRQLDPRVGRWFSEDPVFQPWQSPYCSMDGNPILFNDVLGDDIKIGKYKKEIDPKDYIRQTRLDEIPSSDIEIVNGSMKKGQTKTIEVFCDNGKEVTQKDREKMAEKLPGILKRVERKNKRIRAHNLAIDNKKKLFEEFDPHYDPETGILSNPKLSSGMGKIDDNSVLGILYQTLSSDETYSLKTNKVPWQQRSTAAFSLITHWEPNSFAFLGKNSGALSKNILCLDNKSNLKIMVAADAAEFLGKADHKRATFALFENIETRDWKRTKIDFNFQGIQFKWKGSLPHEDKIKF